MAIYYHFSPILLAPGSVIEPGNFGRIIRLRGTAHPLHRRETEYEAVRQATFPFRPSRLHSLFCFPTHEEAELCRRHIEGYAESVLYEVESHEPDPHIADMNNGLQHCDLAVFDNDLTAYYWQGWRRSSDPEAVILREILLCLPVTVGHKITPVSLS